MSPGTWICACILSGILLVASPPGLAVAENRNRDDCLCYSAENIVKGDGNWFAYVEISREPYTFQKGDRLEYDILLPADIPVASGGLDIELKTDGLPAWLNGRTWVRDMSFVDQNGVKLHGDGDLSAAKEKWHHRSFDLSRLAGATIDRWTLNFEGDKTGRYVMFVDNVRVVRDGKPAFTLYEGGSAPNFELRQCDGYSRDVLFTNATREEAESAAMRPAVLDRAKRQAALRKERAAFRTELDGARKVAEKSGDAHLLQHVKDAEAAEDAAAFDRGDNEAYLQSLHRARQSIAHAHPMMQKYTGHLVGHAHIDLQWLWTWDDSIINIIPQTFGQAVKFMEEFPDFTFSQSSAALYLATEVHHPEMFEQIKKYVAEGRWEIVGGRWCEGDNNMISPESHVRHLLYGQRYFQDRFGKICSVGWEPDTFGHAWTMPQLLKKAGIDSYYFCRAGKGKPLFWWEGPDGSKVLAFEEPATGGWYNDIVSDSKVTELFDFVLGTGALDHMMVYGVGNHGGGPTREHIQSALAMKDRKPWPRIQFSTANEFFGRLHQMSGELKVPTIRDELNPVFDGCYTTHSKVKRANRMAESALEEAEVFAALAAATGLYTYPTRAFENMWTDVLFNHHHDTLPGSFIHPPSFYTSDMLDNVIHRANWIRDDACRALMPSPATPPNRPSHTVAIEVHNPLSWAHDCIVNAEVVLQSPAAEFTVEGDDGTPVQIIHREDNGVGVTRICFLVRKVPACGYKSVSVKAGGRAEAEGPPSHIADIPGVTGKKLASAPNASTIRPKYVIRHEKPGGMTAWVIQEIASEKEVDKPVFEQQIESGPVRWRTRRTYRYDRSTIFEDTITYAHTPRVDFETRVEWLQIGDKATGSDMLKAVFPTGLKTDVATAEVPFGDIERKADGKEYPTLKWVALSDGQKGMAVLNDCKHGYDVKDGNINLTLLRSSYDPDPTPDVGMHVMRYSVMPFEGPVDKGAIARAAWEFNKPATVRVEAQNKNVPGPGNSWSGCEVVPSNIIVTALKQAEDGKDLILRAYECSGKPAKATIRLGFDITRAIETDLLERDMNDAGRVTVSGREISADFAPCEIRTIRLKR